MKGCLFEGTEVTLEQIGSRRRHMIVCILSFCSSVAGLRDAHLRHVVAPIAILCCMAGSPALFDCLGGSVLFLGVSTLVARGSFMAATLHWQPA